MKSIRRWIVPTLAAFGMGLLIIDTRTGFSGAQEGLELSIRTVIPSLFPFFILSNLMTGNLLGQSLPILRPLGLLCGIPKGAESILVVGFLGGYPVGAQSVASAYRSGKLSRWDAQRMLGFCSNAGPSFIFGMAASLFSSPLIPWILWGIHVLSSIIVGSILPGKSSSVVSIKNGPEISVPQALERSVRIMGSVCGWVILFRVILAFGRRWVLWLFPEDAQIILSGLLELAGGCCDLNMIASQADRFVLCSVFLAFGGICVAMQTMSVTGDLGAGLYFPGKLLQAGISLLLSQWLTPILFTEETKTSPFVIPALLIFTLILIIRYTRKKSSGNLALSDV